MKKQTQFVLFALLALLTAFTWSLYRSSVSNPWIPTDVEEEKLFAEEYHAEPYKGEKVVLTPEEWKERLTPEQYEVLREAGTERPFSGKLTFNKEPGVYLCAGCGLDLFSSEDKYDSGTGWPSFTKPINPSHVGYKLDRSLLSTRVEVHCNRCGGHLGHVFNDGPEPTGHRYCINAVSLEFQGAR